MLGGLSNKNRPHSNNVVVPRRQQVPLPDARPSSTSGDYTTWRSTHRRQSDILPPHQLLEEAQFGTSSDGATRFFHRPSNLLTTHGELAPTWEIVSIFSALEAR